MQRVVSKCGRRCQDMCHELSGVVRTYEESQGFFRSCQHLSRVARGCQEFPGCSRAAPFRLKTQLSQSLSKVPKRLRSCLDLAWISLRSRLGLSKGFLEGKGTQ